MSSTKKDTTPAMITATTIMRTSPLRMSEVVAEHRFDFGIVEPIEQPGRHGDRILLGVHAGGESVEPWDSITFSFGVGMPREMQRFSKMVYSRGLSLR